MEENKKNETEQELNKNLEKTQATWQDIIRSMPKKPQTTTAKPKPKKAAAPAEPKKEEPEEKKEEKPLLEQLKRLRLPKLEIPEKKPEEEPKEAPKKKTKVPEDREKPEKKMEEESTSPKKKKPLTEEQRRKILIERRRERQRKRRRKALMMRAAVIGVMALIVILIIAGIVKLVSGGSKKKDAARQAEVVQEAQEAEVEAENRLADAERLAAGYDYDGAISLLQELKADGQDVDAKISEYEGIKGQLQEADLDTIPHVFFHILVADPSITWNLTGEDEYKIADYNQVMTTIDEFKGILQQMYDRGYVLVRLHDMVDETTNEDGETVFTRGKILLPEGKKPFVMSQDDLCYYFYMIGDGYASRMVVGEDGRPTCEYIQEDGTTVTGAYDLVPVLDEFIDEHLDFSYRGAKAVLAFTGYNGVLGYRTDPDLAKTAEEGNKNADEYGVFDYQAEIEKAKPVVQALKDDGYELASHSYGHISYGSDFEKVKEDADKWQERVANVIGETDIILYPFGTDIGSWTGYEDDNEKYQYLRSQGFRFFCNVDSNQYWNQITEDYVRQGRRNLDGYRMYQDLYNGADKLSDLFDVSAVYDQNRPTTGLEEWDGAE